MPRVTIRPVVALVAVSLLLMPAAVRALQQLGALQGTITDATGGILPGATLTATNLDLGVARTTVSNEVGVYRLPSLDPGRYEVTVELQGFRKAVSSGVRVTVGETVGLDVRLSPGEVIETVDVMGRSTDIQTEKADVSAVVDRKKIVDLPLVSRNPLSLAALQPGIVGIPSRSDFLAPEQGIGVNANGQRGGANNATVDGVSINGGPWAGTVLLVPNVEAVQEFRVIANNQSAEFGRNTGAAISIITKGGTNQFTGSLFEFHRNESLRALGLFEQTKPEFTRDDFGFSLGGPVRRDRTFFFTSYEGVREDSARGALYTVETEQFVDFVTRTRPNSIAAQLLNRYRPLAYPTTGLADLGSPAPGANKIGPPDGIPDVGTISVAIPNPRTGDQINGRVDHGLANGRDRLRGSYYHSKVATPFAYLRSAFDQPYPHRNQLLALGYTRIISNTTVNELNFGYLRMHGEAADTTPETPTIAITGLNAGFGAAFWHPISFTQDYFQFKDTVTMSRGSHSLSTGGELTLTWAPAHFHHWERPLYNFGSLLDFADDEPFSETRAVDPTTGLSTSAPVRFFTREFGLFVQDNWKLRSDVTLTLGLRYDNFGNPTQRLRPFNGIQLGQGSTTQERIAGARAGAMDRLYNTDWNNFGPRLGAAWDVSGNATLVVRAGAGLSYNRINNTVWSGEWQNPPAFAQATSTIFDSTPIVYSLGPQYPQNPGLGRGVDERGGILGARVALRGVDPDITTPYAYNWFAGVQRALPWSLTMDVNYIGSAGRNLLSADGPGGEDYNRFTGDLLDGRFDRLNPSFAVVELAESRLSSSYHGLTLQLQRRFARGIGFQTGYTLGQATDSAGRWVDPTQGGLERGPADFDIRHRIASNVIWEIPVITGNRALNYLVGGWQINAIAIFQSGAPFDVTTGAPYPRGDFNADGTTNDRPNAPLSGTDLGSVSREQYLAGVLNAGDFPAPAPGTLGTLGRNAFRGPSYFATDLSVFKNLRLPWVNRSSSRLQIRVEVYNLFNRANLNNPVSNLASPLFGRVTSARPNREVQLGAKFIF